ncbi:L-fucono-1,5-lactonase-like isoform X1 [Littorina saxatilis]|uniref:L-fucono-1,5-lactonase-like isoform X1 n=1 Tax=Littorina saxatilis TaxID=31220 RepID=UPI0038B443BE
MAEIDFDCVDAHFHIWDLQKFSYQWPTPDVPALFRNFTPEDLKEAAKDIPIKHAVFVQVLNNSPEEAIWVSQLAEQHDVIKGVVAGIDVTDPNVKSTLEKVMNGKNKVVGIRHILDNLEDEDTKWLSSDDVISGLRVLENLGIPFDLLLRPHLTKCVLRLSKELPRLKMVVDHLAKPYIKAGLIDEWKKDMTVIAENPNIYCKLSGLVTEADLTNWKEEQFELYVKHILDCFGPGRCMFGSDWPVCTLANASYKDVFNIMLRLVRKLSPGNERAIFRENAMKFYGLKL